MSPPSRSPDRRRGWWIGVAAMLALTGGALAQNGADAGEEQAAVPASALEDFLTQRGLQSLLIDHLVRRVKEGEPAERRQIADRLGTLYGDALEQAKTDDEQRRWQEESLKLLEIVPEADSYSLRLRLAKITYLKAEDLAEQHRLRLIDEDQRKAASAAIRSSAITFIDLGGRLVRQVDALEKREAAGQDPDPQKLRSELDEARKLRSLAMYYAGWSSYYRAFLDGTPQTLSDALESFGWLLNAGGGREASIERLPIQTLKLEHVARAAIGCALVESLRGNHATAERWLDAVESAPDLLDTVRGQIGPRRLVVMIQAKRWADVSTRAKALRVKTDSSSVEQLPAPVAQLVAVSAMEALEAGSVPKLAQDSVRQLVEQSVADLVRQGKVRAVLALAKRYGLGGLTGDTSEGFIVAYVRGLIVYDKARAGHEAEGIDPDGPATKPEVVNLYRESAAALDSAWQGADAERFKDERSGACMLSGMAWLHAGSTVEAAVRLERASTLATQAGATERAEESLWYAVVAYERAAATGIGTLKAERDRVAQLYLATYPRGDRAARLLLRLADSGAIGSEQAIGILMGIERDSPLYEAARRQAAKLMYAQVRSSRGATRDALAVRYADVAFELLGLDQRHAVDATGDARAAASMAVLDRARQMLDVLLGMSTPDADRATRVFRVIDDLDRTIGLDVSAHAQELEYRRLEIALARNDAEAVRQHSASLRTAGGRFAELADRRLYRDAALGWQRSPDNLALAASVVEHGTRVIKTTGSDPSTLSNPAMASLHMTVASAAAAIWKQTKDPVMLALATQLDEAMMGAGPPSASLLRRRAELAEASGNAEAALEAWRTLLAGSDEGSSAWFEARAQSLRLLAGIDPARAREALDQHKLMHPALGPSPWKEELQKLDAALPASSRPSAIGGGSDEPR